MNNVDIAITSAIGLQFGNILYIQDIGLKEKDKVYIDKNTGKLYRCIKAGDIVSNTVEYFEDISLTKKQTTTWLYDQYQEIGAGQTAELHLYDSIDKYNFICMTVSIWERSSGHPQNIEKWASVTIPVSYLLNGYTFFYADTYSGGGNTVAEVIKITASNTNTTDLTIQMLYGAHTSMTGQTCSVQYIFGIK